MMKQEYLFKKLGTILAELNDQYEFLAQNPQQLNTLELELFNANANFLADHVQIVMKMSNNQPLTEKDIALQTAVDSTPIASNFEEESNLIAPKIVQATDEIDVVYDDIKADVFKIDDSSPSTFEFILNDHSIDDKFEFEEKSVDELFNRPLSSDEERIIAEKQRLAAPPIIEELSVDEDEVGPEPFLIEKEEVKIFEPVNEEKIVTAPKVETPTQKVEQIAEEPNAKPTLNDILAGKSASVNLNEQKPAITDLKQAINLNDKLLYIKDLFNGYNLAYAEAIDLANKMPNFDAADNFFQQNYAAKNNWAAKQGTVDKFYELLNQRFK